MIEHDNARIATSRPAAKLVEGKGIAAIAGSAVGALDGDASLPARWRDNLLGRTPEKRQRRTGKPSCTRRINAIRATP